MKPLFTWKDIESKEQYKTIEEAGYLLDLLRKKYRWNIFDLLSTADSKIIGLGILGSTVKGYAINSAGKYPSDLDVCIIYDDPGTDAEDSLEKTINKCFPRCEEKAQRNIQLLEEINIAQLSKEEVIKNPHLSIGGLMFPILGNVTRIKHCHDKIRTFIADLSVEEKEDWVRRFVDKIYEDTSKQIERGFIRAEEKEAYKKDRLQLYEKRIRKLFID
jgi:hypothetical protein